MERKIGEIFEYEGEWYQCVKEHMIDYCYGCTLFKNQACTAIYASHDCWLKAKCKKLEPVGDPHPLYGHIVQRYAGVKFPVVLTEKRFINCNEINNTVDIEIKQNKNQEDMETSEKTITVPDGWEFDRIDDSGNIVLKEKKKELPKTWLECLYSIGDIEYIEEDSEIDKGNISDQFYKGRSFDYYDHNLLPRGLGNPMLALCQLLVCRNAWWKQLGWKPDWNNNHPSKHCIKTIRNEIEKYTSDMWNCILAFPTEDIRNLFLETFKDLIKEAKELL